MADHHHHHHHHYYQDAGRSTPSPNPHRLYRSRDRLLGGVCAGIAAYLGWPRLVVRLAAVLFALMFTPGAILLYLLAWWIIPSGPKGKVYESPEQERFWRTVSTRPTVTMSELRHKFRGLDGRITDMERIITSEEYRLKRAFRDLEDNA